MSQTQPVFGGMLHRLVDLGLFELDIKPLDTLVERRLKQFWEYTTCPRCGHPSIHTWDSSDHVICRGCNFKPIYTYSTPFHEEHLTAGEVLPAYLLYAGTLLSISQVAVVLDRVYKTVYYATQEVEVAITRGFPLVWEQFQHSISDPTQIDESGTVYSGYKGRGPSRISRYRGGSSRSRRSQWKGRYGDQITPVAACHDVPRVIRGHLEISYQGNLEPVLQEAKDFPQRLGEVWADGLQAYREVEYDHRTVIHDERYVPADGIRINQAECLFSLVKPWLRRLRDLSRQGLEQATHTFGIVRSLSLVGASLEIAVGCLATESLYSSA